MMGELDDILERVTRAEERMNAATLRSEQWHGEAVESMQAVEDRIARLEQALAKYTGFWGAIMLVISAIGTFLMLAKEFFQHKFGVDG